MPENVIRNSSREDAARSPEQSIEAIGFQA